MVLLGVGEGWWFCWGLLGVCGLDEGFGKTGSQRRFEV